MADAAKRQKAEAVTWCIRTSAAPSRSSAQEADAVPEQEHPPPLILETILCRHVELPACYGLQEPQAKRQKAGEVEPIPAMAWHWRFVVF